MIISEGSLGWFRGWQHRRQHEVNLSSIPDLHGKVALVTGANGGIGKVASQVLAERGAKVYAQHRAFPNQYQHTLMRPSFMACRSQTKADAAIAEIHQQTPTADIEFLAYDASSLEKVHAAGKAFLERDLPLDILLLNAGTIVGEPQASADGLEWIFAVNHLAHFVLVMTVLPAVERAARQHGDVRIVSTTSAGFGLHPDPKSLHLDDAELDVAGKDLWWQGAMPMYGRSKTCNILFTSELSRRLRALPWGKEVRCNACHPGTISTGLNDSLRTSWYFWTLETVVYALAAIPTSHGAINLLYAATSPEIPDKDITGKYLTPYGYVNSAPEGTPATDLKLGTQLWERSVELCGKFVGRLRMPEGL
ncbi:MAG: hypothetical protein M1817_000915 [Caeruleum heppii]|nr:MAG: hypothetical protein M1817_000915 [Caeruleum heppii]